VWWRGRADAPVPKNRRGTTSPVKPQKPGRNPAKSHSSFLTMFSRNQRMHYTPLELVFNPLNPGGGGRRVDLEAKLLPSF
jgi:hypothetical protein